MPDRAQQLAIIQKLIDAGESQENIDTVVESFKQTAHPPAGSGPNPFSAERRDDRPVEEPGVLETIGRSLFKAAAQPESAGDVASLMTATPMMGAGRIASQAAQLPGQVPGVLRAMGRGAGKTISHVAEEYVPYWAKPFEGAGKDIGGWLQKVSQEPGIIGGGSKYGPNPAGAVSGPVGPPSSEPMWQQRGFQDLASKPPALDLNPQVRTGPMGYTGSLEPVSSPPSAGPIANVQRESVLRQMAPAEKIPKLTAEEFAVGQQLMAKGMSQQEAIDAILLQRKFRSTVPGTMTGSEVRSSLDRRNNIGELKTPSAETARTRR